jgi:penicillin-binding protein 2
VRHTPGSSSSLFSAIKAFMKGIFPVFSRLPILILAMVLAAAAALAVTATEADPAKKPAKKSAKKTTQAAKKPAAKSPKAIASAKPAPVPLAAKVPPAMVAGTIARANQKAKRGAGQTWDEPTYKDSTAGDNVDGEDLTVRQAAVEALGPMNGSVVAVDPETGRILTIVNQQLALGGGFQPCSTVKVSVSLAALREGLVERTSPVKFYSKRSLDLTDALAYSNNSYFATLGVKLGYERVNYYAHLFGYGEKAGLNIPGEHAGYFPPAPPKNGGMGMLTSFGEEIEQTPLELAGLMTAIANGGTLYWLQYPRSDEEIKAFTPQVKRHLDIANYIDEIKPGMRGAVEFGTAKRARQDDLILGKTGTCSEGRTHLGWFGSFRDSGSRKLVVVVMLTGGRPSIGPMASGVAGDVYRRLAADNYFKMTAPLTPASILAPRICCSR